jgi:hypothetical protein
MNRAQKIAWFQLAVVGIAVVMSVILTLAFRRKYGYEFVEAWWLAVGYSTPLLIFAVLGPAFIFRKKKGKVDFDERDLMIDRRAMIVSFGATYMFFILVCFVTWLAAGLDSPIPAYWLLRIVTGGWLTSIVGHSLTTLVCYGRGGKGGE